MFSSINRRNLTDYKLEEANNDLIYGKASLPWCEIKQGWIAPGGALIKNRRHAGDIVERMHKAMSGDKHDNSI